MSESLNQTHLLPSDKHAFIEKAGKAGLKVPSLYPTLPDAFAAIRRGEIIIVRSNDIWPGNMPEPSGVARSFVITHSTICDGNPQGLPPNSMWKQAVADGDIETVTQLLEAEEERENVKAFALLTGIDPTTITQSPVYQTYIPGKRITFAADTAIRDKYHLTITDDDSTCHQFAIDWSKNGPTVANLSKSTLPPEIAKHLKGLIETNNAIERMYDSNMKYVLEFVAGEAEYSGQLFVVQALGNQLFQGDNIFPKHQQNPTHSCQATFVRGKTFQSDLEIVTDAWFLHNRLTDDDYRAIRTQFPHSIRGSAVALRNTAVREWLLKKAPYLQVFLSQNGFFDSHRVNSLLHKPQTTVVISTNEWEQFVAGKPSSDKQTYPIRLPSFDDEELQIETVRATVSSDGKEAFLT